MKLKLNKFMLIVLLFVGFVQSIFAGLELENIQFDPNVIVAGDNVDIFVQFRATSSFLEDEKVGNKDYSFEVELVGDDDLTENYVLIEDSLGDNLKGSVFSDFSYVKKYRVKVLPSAPVGKYQFKLVGQWYKNGVPLSFKEELKFFMEVKREGIILSASSPITNPTQVRPGDNAVEVSTFIENVGEKDAKLVNVDLGLPEGFSHTYSNNNKFSVGRLNSGDMKEARFFVDVGNNVKSGVYNLSLDFNYLDVDDNENSKTIIIPFLVKPKAVFEVVGVRSSARVGSDGFIEVDIKNVGESKAENVDVRVLKENSQPFSFEIRSDYIGEIKPNETKTAVFRFKVLSDAPVKEHSLSLQIRSKGDSDLGDDRIYTYIRNASFNVEEGSGNKFLIYGFIGLLALVFIIFFRKFGGNKK